MSSALSLLCCAGFSEYSLRYSLKSGTLMSVWALLKDCDSILKLSFLRFFFRFYSWLYFVTGEAIGDFKVSGEKEFAKWKGRRGAGFAGQSHMFVMAVMVSVIDIHSDHWLRCHFARRSENHACCGCVVEFGNSAQSAHFC